ncbi:MAG: PDZ domain-containing protein, partial [Planctomycetota bacterium]
DGVTWVGLLAGAEGRWTPVRKPARVDALLADETQGAGQAYSDPPFRGPVATICALILDADGNAVGLMVPRPPAQTGRAGGRGGMMRRGGAGLPVVRPASSFAQYLGGEIAARGILGITGEALGEKVAQALGVEDTRGVLITQVTPASGAAAAGIEAQMIILKVGEQPTPTLAALQQALRGKQAGETVGVTVLKLADDGPVTKTISVELTAREAPDKKNRLRARRFGFQAEPLTALVRRTYGLGEDVSGLHVRRVTRGSPAALARPTALRRGDVILRVGDTPVKDLDALKQALEAIANGTSVTLFVRHASDTRFVEIKPEAPTER